MPKKKKDKKKDDKKGKKKAEEEKDVEQKPYEAPDSSYKEVELKREWVAVAVWPVRVQLAASGVCAPIFCRLDELNQELSSLKKQVNDLYPLH